MKPEYIEGPEALENFERLATAVFRSPRPNIVTPKKKNAKQPKATSRKSKRSDKD
ncbi:MAG: hypothetical protein WAN65_26260 [Candidatus Sulfotelmatobacter sp.]